MQAALLAQGHQQVSFEEQQVPGFYAGIDEKGRLFEMGWTKWPTLMHLAWQARDTSLAGAFCVGCMRETHLSRAVPSLAMVVVPVHVES